MVYEDLSIDFGRRNKHPKSRYGVQTRLQALLEPAIKRDLLGYNVSLKKSGESKLSAKVKFSPLSEVSYL